MNRVRTATVAIVRRQCDRAWLFDAGGAVCLGMLIAVLLQHRPEPAGLALSAVIAARPQHGGRLRDLTYFALPLYGRELARAHVVAPVLLAVTTPTAFAVTSAVLGQPPALAAYAISALAAAVWTVVALVAQFRTGQAPGFFDAPAFAAGLTVTVTLLLPGTLAAVAGLGLGLLIGYVALRQLGETLARYDPLPEPADFWAT